MLLLVGCELVVRHSKAAISFAGVGGYISCGFG